jgi:hypothetical protein
VSQVDLTDGRGGVGRWGRSQIRKLALYGELATHGVPGKGAKVQINIKYTVKVQRHPVVPPSIPQSYTAVMKSKHKLLGVQVFKNVISAP